MAICINGLSNISPQPTFDNTGFLDRVVEYKSNMLLCIEPDYSQFLNPNQLRRMGRVLKLGCAGAKLCLDDAGIETPDSILVGTGKGCFSNTEKFLFSVLENDETLVAPSPFIQSAHGSIASQIAIMTQCRNYNMTYAHRGFSFESALMDAIMLLDEAQCNNVLLGGIDEIETNQFKTFERIGFWKKKEQNNLDLFREKSNGTIAGEGSSFFLLENRRRENTYAEIKAVDTFSHPGNLNAIKNKIDIFLQNNSVSADEIDLVILGCNGDALFDPIYADVADQHFKNTNQTRFKHLCGDYLTASAFAVWLAAKTIHQQFIPQAIRFKLIHDKPISKVLIYNQYRNTNHSLILLSN